MLQNAAKNILWIFTNAKGTGYHPGDTLVPLLDLVEEYKHFGLTATSENWFCFDNESFRYIAKIEKGLEDQTDINKKESYAKSWDLATNEVKRLISKVSILKPHQIRGSASIHDARRMIVESAVPRALFIKIIEENLMNIQIVLENLKSDNFPSNMGTLLHIRSSKFYAILYSGKRNLGS